jgi:hypothetical protein
MFGTAIQQVAVLDVVTDHGPEFTFEYPAKVVVGIWDKREGGRREVTGHMGWEAYHIYIHTCIYIRVLFLPTASGAERKVNGGGGGERGRSRTKEGGWKRGRKGGLDAPISEGGAQTISSRCHLSYLDWMKKRGVFT